MDKPFVIHRLTPANYCIEWQMPISLRRHHLGTIGTETINDGIAGIRQDFTFYLLSASMELHGCLESEIAKQSIGNYIKWLTEVFAGRKNHTPHTVWTQYNKMSTAVRSQCNQQDIIHHLDVLSDLCMRFILNWVDPQRNPLPIELLLQQAA